MVRYFNPPDKLRQIGRKLQPGLTLDDLQNQLKENEFLIGLYYNGIFTNTPYLGSPAIFNRCEQDSIKKEYYAITREMFNEYVK